MGGSRGVPPKLYTQKLDMCASPIVPMMGHAANLDSHLMPYWPNGPANQGRLDDCECVGNTRVYSSDSTVPMLSAAPKPTPNVQGTPSSKMSAYQEAAAFWVPGSLGDGVCSPLHCRVLNHEQESQPCSDHLAQVGLRHASCFLSTLFTIVV